jgi:hypothetical protein
MPSKCAAGRFDEAQIWAAVGTQITATSAESSTRASVLASSRPSARSSAIS